MEYSCPDAYDLTIKGAAHLEKRSLDLSSSSFVIRGNLLHPYLTILVPLWFIVISLVFFLSW